MRFFRRKPLSDEDRKRLFYEDREREAKKHRQEQTFLRGAEHVGRRAGKAKVRHHSSRQPMGLKLSRIPR